VGGTWTWVASETEVLSPEYSDELTEPFVSDVFLDQVSACVSIY
jgi:hypothetical protein